MAPNVVCAFFVFVDRARKRWFPFGVSTPTTMKAKAECGGECGRNVVFPWCSNGGGPMQSLPNRRSSMRKFIRESFVAMCCAALLAAAAASRAADEDAKVDAYIRAEMQRERIPGLALGVYRDGKMVRAQGYGIANLEWNASVTPDTIFQSGSVGKQFTATAIMMLVEEGKVGLDDPVQKYFPRSPSWWAQVTIRELLSHTAGFTDYPRDFDYRKDYTEED